MSKPQSILEYGKWDYSQFSDNQLFSMYNRTTYAPSKRAMKAELKKRGYFSY